MAHRTAGARSGERCATRVREQVENVRSRTVGRLSVSRDPVPQRTRFREHAEMTGGRGCESHRDVVDRDDPA